MAKSKGKSVQQKFVAEMKRIAKAQGVDPSDLKKAEFYEEASEELNDWQLRKLGGYNSLQSLYFPKEVDLETKSGTRLLKAHKNKIEKQYGDLTFFKNEVLEGIMEILEAQPINMYKANPTKSKKKANINRSLVAHISDTHFGSNIDSKEMHGLNEFNWTIASRRLALLVTQIENYKPEYRKNTELVLQINGDIIAGQIHNQEWFVDLLTTQFAGTLNILSQAISHLATKFPKVRVICTPGNHGRNVGKADRGRATVQKWDSYENMIYIALNNELSKEHKNVEFTIPESPFALYKVQGHYVFQTHGDTIINVGNPGNSLNMKSINEQINNINGSQLLKKEEKVAVVSVGHVHVPTIQRLDNGCMLVVNGCLSGADPFAQSIGIFSNNPTQVIFEATEKHPVGDIRMINLNSADKNAEYDKLIKPFSGKF